jgi:hypothetical protein
MPRSLLLAGTIALLTVGTMLTASQALAASGTGHGSQAAVLHATFTFNGSKHDYGFELPADGAAPPAYDTKTAKASYMQTSKFDSLTFTRSATKVEAEATGKANIATGTVATTGTATIGGFSGKLTSAAGTLMTVTTGKIMSQATYSQTSSGAHSVNGATSLLNVHIDAPVFGFNKTYSGNPKPNQVLYHNKDNTIVVYLNRQVTTTANGKPASIAVAAVDVQINNYKFAGQHISGTFMVAPTEAQ